MFTRIYVYIDNYKFISIWMCLNLKMFEFIVCLNLDS